MYGFRKIKIKQTDQQTDKDRSGVRSIYKGRERERERERAPCYRNRQKIR